ncbi:MAG: SPOR domain-containing protein [Casimicrobiaceae bacterium]
MRIVLILLLLANLTLYAYTRLDSGSSEAVLLQDQIQPDKIKLLSPQQVAALGPAKVAALADVCIEWGPLADPERTRALADVEPLALGRLLTQKRVEFDSGYWVTVGPFSNRGTAETRVTEFRRQGAKDLAIADAGRGQFAVSFGTFRTEAAAVARADELAALGINVAKVQPRGAAITQTLLVIRDPQQPVVARLKDLQAQYPGTEVKVGACERTT